MSKESDVLIAALREKLRACTKELDAHRTSAVMLEGKLEGLVFAIQQAEGNAQRFAPPVAGRLNE